MVIFPLTNPTCSSWEKSRRPSRIANPQTERKITEREAPMIIKALITTVALLLAGYAFWDGALSGGHVLNPFGILFLFLSGAVWFGWKPLREIFRSTRDDSVIPTIAAGAGWSIKGMGKGAPPPRQSSSS